MGKKQFVQFLCLLKKKRHAFGSMLLNQKGKVA